MDPKQLDVPEPTERPECEEGESFETMQEATAPEATGQEDLRLRELSFVFVASLQPVDACECRDDGLEVSEKEADCRLSLAVPHHPLGRLRCALASVCST